MRRRLTTLLAVLLAGCARPPTSFAPGPPHPPVCSLEGCDGTRAAAIAASHAPDACPSAGQAPCQGASPDACTARALAAWAEADDDRQVACVARTLTDACSLGDPRACGFAGRMALDGRGVAKDAEKGVAMLEHACDEGQELACMAAIRWLADASHAQAVKGAPLVRRRLEVESSCLAGSADACLQIGGALSQGAEPYPRDLARSAAEYRRGCDLGNGLACNNLGDAYEYGRAVPRDLSRAAGLYERACRAGRPIGCSNLGHLLQHGEGVTEDLSRARSLYRDACVAGDVYGCLHVQLLAAEDAGAPRDATRSVAHWQRACDGRDARACAFVGLLFEDGPDGYARDEGRSLRAMKRACDLGFRPGCDWLEDHPGS
ncbi:MAG TPA: tetratricopeptide repeat protein [Polyangiaceae bacterium]